MKITTKENAKSIKRLKLALYATIVTLAILSACTIIAIESLWTAII